MLVAFLLALGGEPKLPSFFSDHMVLQRETRVPLWGTAAPGARLEFSPEWRPAPPVVITADANGRWRAELDTPAAGGPFVIRIAHPGGTLELRDVLVGEVWLASGQSNMEWTLGPVVGSGVEGWEEALQSAHDPRLRFFQVENALAADPEDDVRGSWVQSSAESARGFSATAYFFARTLRSELAVPVGVISSEWGGTPAEAWVRADRLAEFPEFTAALVALAGSQASNPNAPSVLWNGMIAPLVPAAIRGVIWYQGESNRERAEQYRTLFPALIRDWRAAFGRGDFPFYFVQIAPFAYEGDTGEAARLREAQGCALALPNTGMAVTMDIGDPSDIHPHKKREVGERLALWALARTYGRERECAGPLYRRMSTVGSAIRLEFEHAQGLTSRGEPVRHATIAGADRVFHPAEARIEGESLLVSCPEVRAPVAVRFGWGAADMTNLWNAAGLPASSFRTDDWP